MSVSYVVKKKKLGFSKSKEEKYLPVVAIRPVASLDEVLEEVSDISALSPGDVKSAFCTLTKIISRHLKQGRTIDLGELGRLRLSLRVKSSDTAQEVSSEQIRRSWITFWPGKQLRQALKEVQYVRFSQSDIIEDGKEESKEKEEGHTPLPSGKNTEEIGD